MPKRSEIQRQRSGGTPLPHAPEGRESAREAQKSKETRGRGLERSVEVKTLLYGEAKRRPILLEERNRGDRGRGRFLNEDDRP